MGEGRAAKRYKWRLPCEIISDGRSQRAIVLDISESGIFVQTSTRLPPGAEVDVRLRLERCDEPALLRARVARNKQVPPQLTSVARGGIGLKILDAPIAYYDQVAALGGEARPPPPAIAAPEPARSRFRVRVKQCEGPRSSSIELLADSVDDARARALADVGAGWEAFAAEAIA